MDGQDPSDRLYQVGVGLGSPEISCNDQFGDPGIALAVIGEISVVFGSRCGRSPIVGPPCSRATA